jgi:hypothetical protein
VVGMMELGAMNHRRGDQRARLRWQAECLTGESANNNKNCACHQCTYNGRDKLREHLELTSWRASSAALERRNRWRSCLQGRQALQDCAKLWRTSLT